MGRSKPRPKRRRLEDEAAEREAIALLRQTPDDVVEQAAADATREDLVRWPWLPPSEEQDVVAAAVADGRLRRPLPPAPPTAADVETVLGGGDRDDGGGNDGRAAAGVRAQVPSWLDGLGTARSLSPDDFASLVALHRLIKDGASQWASWSGVERDPRKRAFGFLPGTLGHDPECRGLLDITMPWREPALGGEDEGDGGTGINGLAPDSDAAERRRNERAIVVLDDLPEGTQDAIDNVCRLFQDDLRVTASKFFSSNDKINDDGDDDGGRYYQQLAEFLQYRNLIAAQPNLHNGRELLPSHLDHPLKDGFGVVILTVAVHGGGTVLLQDAGEAAAAGSSPRRMAMRLEVGQAYMLAGRSRDACIHGVLADPDAANRESLNLRFGLHGYCPHGGAWGGGGAAATPSDGPPSTPAGSDGAGADHEGPGRTDWAAVASSTPNGCPTTTLPVIAASQVLKHWEDPSTDYI